MSEQSGVPSALQLQLRTSTFGTLTNDAEVGMTAEELGYLLGYTRSSNVHTHPPQVNPKPDPISQFNSNHMNPFLRMYLSGATAVTEEALIEIAKLCRMNDTAWVDRCQHLSYKTLISEMESRAVGKERSLVFKADDPLVLPQLRANLPWLADNSKVPQLNISKTHFRHIVDVGSNRESGVAQAASASGEERDRFFSSQVRIKNEGKQPIAIKIVQRCSLIDGSVVQKGRGGENEGQLDFQIILDRETIKKGDTATLLLSLIAKPSAVFTDVLELIVLQIDSGIKLAVSFGVVNPFLPLFGTPIPASITQRVVGTPLGSYEAPSVLQMLKHKFILHHGLVCEDLGSLLGTQSLPHAEQNAALIRDAMALRSQLDDEANIVDIIASTAEIAKKQLKQAANSASPAKSGSPSSAGNDLPDSGDSTTIASSLVDTKGGSTGLPNSTSFPQGFVPGSTTMKNKATSTAAFNEHSVHFPQCLNAADPRVMFVTIIMWFMEYPQPIVDESICGCDAFAYIEGLSPSAQGLLWWAVDLCCVLLLHSGANKCNVRSLSVCFANAVLAAGRDGGATLGQTGEDGSLHGTAAVKLQMHTTTAFVKWISRYREGFKHREST